MALALDPAPWLEMGELGWAAVEVSLGSLLDPAVRRHQAQQRLQSLVQFAREHAPFYTDLYRGLPAGVAPALSDLPVVTKSALMADVTAGLTDRSITREELERFTADETRVGQLLRGRYAVWSSSGTSGKPGLFLHDLHALAVYEALSTLRFRGLSSFAEYGVRLLAGERFALVMVTGGHFASVASAEHLRNAFPWLAPSVAAFSLLSPIAELVERLNAFRPTLLATYPSAAEMLAREQEAGNLKLRLSELWTGGEFLAPCVKTRLERTFGCRVRNEYGASEFLSIASECPRGNLHVNDDWVLLEPVDRAGRPMALGKPSHTTLLTNLANRVQPLIRYDLGDSITLLPPCPCGNTLPAVRVEGRRDDMLHFADAGGRMVDLLPLVLTTVMEEDGGVYDFQLVQTGAHTLHVSLGGEARAAQERVRAALLGLLARSHLANVELEIDAFAPRRSPAGKVRRVVCAFPPDKPASIA